MEDLLQGLNEAQRRAVTTTEGFVRVIAGAGSGKTRALTRRFAYLVNELGILPGNILCVTFTNKAANEMRQRIHNLIGDNDTGYINTFHGFCVSVLQEDSHAVQYPKSFLVLDNSDIDTMLEEIYAERGLTLRDMTYSDARDMIEIQKLFKDPEYYLDMLQRSPQQLRDRYEQATRAEDIIFRGYLYQERKCFAFDYNDLIKVTLHIFQQRKEIREKWQQRLQYILIDEFQDIDLLQYQLMEALCGYHQNLFVVGDPDQTIYTWRGADIRYLLEFDQKFPGTKTILMNQNYRSTPEITEVCNSLIAANRNRIAKSLQAMRPAGRKVLCHYADDANSEASWIADQMEALHGEGCAYRDMTVLYRAHYVTRTLETELLARKIPYIIYSGVPFFGRREIKDALSYLRMIVYKDDLSFRRIANVPRRNLGKRRMQFLEEKAQEKGGTLYEALTAELEDPIFRNTSAAKLVRLVEEFAGSYEGRPVSEVLTELLERSGYEKLLRTEGSQERLDNLAELKQAVREYEVTCGEESSLPDYLQHVALFTNADAGDPGDKVKLMTVHAAKGLEFKNVFLCAMNEGIFPSRKTRTRPGMEEERRLAFVAMTRAEDRLFLSESQGRIFDGTPKYPSRFLLDIDAKLLDMDVTPHDSLIRETRDYLTLSEKYLVDREQKPKFAVDDRVRHAMLGTGTVLAVNTDKKFYRIQFDSLKTPRDISFRITLEAAEKEDTP
jgi:DNA helicase-2/ATP-dependent DNA helicase PcrA